MSGTWPVWNSRSGTTERPECPERPEPPEHVQNVQKNVPGQHRQHPLTGPMRWNVGSSRESVSRLISADTVLNEKGDVDHIVRRAFTWCLGELKCHKEHVRVDVIALGRELVVEDVSIGVLCNEGLLIDGHQQIVQTDGLLRPAHVCIWTNPRGTGYGITPMVSPESGKWFAMVGNGLRRPQDVLGTAQGRPRDVPA